MSPREVFALRDYLDPGLKGRTLSDARQVVPLTEFASETCLEGRLGELQGRSVLLAVADQLVSALAIMEIDGVARRMLLCPPGLNADHFKTLIEDAEIDAIVTDQPARWADAEVYLVVAARAPVRMMVSDSLAAIWSLNSVVSDGWSPDHGAPPIAACVPRILLQVVFWAWLVWAPYPQLEREPSFSSLNNSNARWTLLGTS